MPAARQRGADAPCSRCLGLVRRCPRRAAPRPRSSSACSRVGRRARRSARAISAAIASALRGVAAPQRHARLEHAHRPLIPAARLRVLAVGLARPLQAAAGLLVVAANQVNLRQRVEHRAGRLAHELQRAADVERAVERLLGARQVAERARRSARARRARCRGRAACPPPPAARRCARRAPAPDRGGAASSPRSPGCRRRSRRRRRRRTISASRSAWRSAAIASSRRPSCASVTPRQRVDHRQVPQVAGGVQRRGRLRDVLADDGACRRPGGSRARARSGRGRSRASRARARPASAPCRGTRCRATARRGRSASLPCSRHSSDSRAGWSRSRSSGGSPERLGRLADVVLQEPGFGQRAANLERLVAAQPGLLERADEEGRGFGAVSVLQGLGGLAKRSAAAAMARAVYLVYSMRQSRLPDQLPTRADPIGASGGFSEPSVGAPRVARRSGR